ncbi:MAG: hypothetical protein HY905_17025 [Deltaproteobacteria bacterium]|nr:hypothetical protein [Deltaproteobacteria bacterium]
MNNPRIVGLLVASVGLGIPAACNHDPSRAAAMASQPSPDAQSVLEPSLHDGTLVRLTVRRADEGALADSVDTRESDAMKWIVGWVDDTSYVFWGADMGTRWVRAFDGNTWSERPSTDADCAALERLFEAKYGERRGDCLRPE